MATNSALLHETRNALAGSVIRIGKLLLNVGRIGIDRLRRRPILLRYLHLPKCLLDIGKISLRIQAAASTVRRPFMLNQAAIGNDRQHVLHGRLRHRLCGRAMLRIRTIFVLRPKSVHYKSKVPLRIALAG